MFAIAAPISRPREEPGLRGDVVAVLRNRAFRQSTPEQRHRRRGYT